MQNDRVENAASHSDPLVVATLNAFDARLKQLEKPEEKTRLARVQKNASFLALMIGILLSVFSLFDIFWSKPREARFHDIDEFNKTVNAVATLRQNMVRVQFESQKPEMILFMNSMVTPQVLANIQYATALLPRLGDDAGIPQLIVLISEAINIHDWKNAAVLVERAVRAKDAVPTLRSEALRYKGRLMFVTEKFDEGRQAYQEALRVLDKERGYGINGIRAYIVADWTILEFSVGDCGLANERLGQFIELVQHPQIAATLRGQLIATLKGQLAEVLREKRCPLPVALDGIG